LEGSPDPGGSFLWISVLSQILAAGFMFYSMSGLLLIVLLLLSALVSGSEVAFFSFSPDDIDSLKNSPSSKERKVYALINHPKRLLATILIFNNFINVAIVTISTYITWRIIGPGGNDGVVILVLSMIITFLIVLLGEVTPKVYAAQNNLSFVRITAGMLTIADKVFYPVSWVLLNMSNFIERNIEKKGYRLSLDELNHALEITSGTDTSEEEKEILKGIVNFGTISAKQIMHSRMDIMAVEIDTDFHELMDRINKFEYSRIPVYRETIDKIEGILFVKDLLAYIHKDEHFEWQKLIRPGYFIPEHKKIDTLLKDFQSMRMHMAIVVDEYGGTSGVITLEDIIEEIVGEINDEFDEEDVSFTQLDENTYVFEGKTSLNDFCKVIDEDPDIFEEVKGESESLGGLLLEIASKMPRLGEKIFFDKYMFSIVAVDSRRIKRIKVHITEKKTKNEIY
jgi:putative hemolysin